MTTSQRIALRLSGVRHRLNEIAGLDELTDEVQSGSAILEKRVPRPLAC